MMAVTGVDRFVGTDCLHSVRAYRRHEALGDDHLGRVSAHRVGDQIADWKDDEMMVALEVVIAEQRLDPHTPLENPGPDQPSGGQPGQTQGGDAGASPGLPAAGDEPA